MNLGLWARKALLTFFSIFLFFVTLRAASASSIARVSPTSNSFLWAFLAFGLLSVFVLVSAVVLAIRKRKRLQNAQ